MVTFLSCINNCNQDTSLDFRLLHDGVTRERLDKFEHCISPFLGNKHKLSFHQPPHDFLGKFALYGRMQSKLAYARLFIADMFKDCDTALYIDSDIIVQKDVSRLCNIDLGDIPLAAVLDSRATFARGCGEMVVWREVGCDENAAFFNSGLMLLNLKQWRKENLIGRCVEIAQKYKGQFVQNDQELLNIVACNRWVELPGSYNFHVILYPNKPRIRHFDSNHVNYHCIKEFKPWFIGHNTNCEIVNLFYSYLDRTEWELYCPDNIRFTSKRRRWIYAQRWCRMKIYDVVYMVGSALEGREMLRRA